MAANATILHKLWAEGKEYVVVTGSWATNADSDIAAASVKGKGFSVARTDVGVATITFNERYTELVSFDCDMRLGTAADQIVQGGVYTAPTATADGTIVVNCWDISSAAVAEWPAADDDNVVSFTAIFRKTSVET